jgi:hypothetical protein
MNIMIIIDKLPDDLIKLINEYIPKKALLFTNKMYYELYHPLIKTYISNYESYTRDMIRRDNEFVFEKIIRENFNKWSANRQYSYQHMLFNSYINFIMYFCIENESEKCRTILLNLFEERNFNRNRHKKNVIKYIKWNN